MKELTRDGYLEWQAEARDDDGYAQFLAHMEGVSHAAEQQQTSPVDPYQHFLDLVDAFEAGFEVGYTYRRLS